MWLGVGAGLPLLLLTWIIARPVYASNVFVNDQQLDYEGQGWEVAAAPQSCSSLSPTVHTTSVTGDSVTFNFTGNAVSVRGPLTTLSTPMTIVVDGNIKSIGPPVQGSDGCGTFFTDTDLDGSQGHVLTMVFAAASGSVRFGISGITLNTLDAVPNANALLTQTQSVPLPATSSPTLSATPTGGTSSNLISITPSSNPSSTAPLVMSSAVASNASSTSSGVPTTTFVTNPSMTTVIIGAIVGTIVAMLGLLAFFVVLRRRISRTTARKLDQENTIGRWGRDLGDSKGKIQEDSGLASMWSSKMGELRQSDLESTPREKAGSMADVSNSSSILGPAASIQGTLSQQAVTITYPSTAPSYTIPLETALRRHSSVSDAGSDNQSQPERPLTKRSSRPAPPPISVPRLPSVSPALFLTPYSQPMPTGRLAAVPTMDPTSAYSAAATIGDGQEGHGLRVINWSGPIETPGLSAKKLPQPPPGFI